MKIPLTQGKVATVSACDHQRVLDQGKWKYHKGRPTRSAKGGEVVLARFVLGVPKEVKVRYADGDRLNCQRGNLIVDDRAATDKDWIIEEITSLGQAIVGIQEAISEVHERFDVIRQRVGYLGVLPQG
jgi:hypothetical protein